MQKFPILKDILVIELAFMGSGPFCGALLASLGANVIKIEPIKGGDMFRFMPPFGQTEEQGEKVNAAFQAINNNKRSLAMNFRKGLGKSALLDMLKQADVLIEGFKPGRMDSWGLGYADLHKINPRLIYCHISGYGLTGPRASQMQHEGNIGALSGLLDSFSTENNRPSLAPGLSLVGGYTALSGILAALYHRQQSQQGQLVDVAVLDALMAMQAPSAGELLDTTLPRQGQAFLQGNWPRNRIYACACGNFLYFGAGEQRYFQAFLHKTGHGFIAELVNYQDQCKALETLFLSRSRSAWLQEFDQQEYCLSAVNSLQQALEDPQVMARGALKKDTSADHKQHVHLGQVIKMSAHLPPPFSSAPGLGQHSRDVLIEFGLQPEQIQAMIAANLLR
ncbi:CaiB/BaiF CoA transferase family protein [Bowmanella denitrificans]|uniref:CaiB/BaiF CoA transferase family protein n=1 Tax=Bowmanella denitrificans TaxID=366582 RepID=UPI000C9B4654|nr:CaiB/BaiF CoA-transferase family protein [Bowmanella denitrificans]